MLSIFLYKYINKLRDTCLNYIKFLSKNFLGIDFCKDKIPILAQFYNGH